MVLVDNERLVNLLGALAVATGDEITLATNQFGARRESDAAALNFIGHAAGLSVDELSAVMHLSQPATTRLVDRLVEDGFVEKRRGHDHKTIALHLTSSGHRKRTSVQGARFRRIAPFFDALDASERAELERIVEKMLLSTVRDGQHAGSVCRLCNERACDPCPMDQLV